ncbi:MAG: ribbon-helix-helix domain-containing protein [Alphaproteobacteria bacterium]|nr:MAG: ribbon-helix-helix domain-containing protein [Alphaproteobacteria bacterium]
MKSSVIKKRSIAVAGRRTSISLEDEFWKNLREIAWERRQTLSHLIASIDEDRQFANLSSAIRLFVLRYYRDRRSGYLTRARPVNHNSIGDDQALQMIRRSRRIKVVNFCRLRWSDELTPPVLLMGMAS